MANPLIPGISATEQDLLYKKLSIYNQKKASFKEAGAYLVVLPRTDYPRYSLWVYSPLPERQSIFYIFDLNEDVHEALRIASTLCYYSLRPLLLVEYNAKRMQNRGDDIISFGKYHGHYLHEILRIDPGYLTWIASLPGYLSRSVSYKSPEYTIPYTSTSCSEKPDSPLPDVFWARKGRKWRI